eukprot:328380-Amphidinium_carterae.1
MQQTSALRMYPHRESRLELAPAVGFGLRAAATREIWDVKAEGACCSTMLAGFSSLRSMD